MFNSGLIKNKWVWFTILFTGLCIAFYIYVAPLFKPAIATFDNKPIVLYIPSGASYKNVKDSLVIAGVLTNVDHFNRIATLMQYAKDEVPGGKYILKDRMTAREVIGKLRSGNQDPVNVVVNNVRTLPELAGKLDRYFEIDSLTILQYFTREDVLKEYHLTPETVLTLFIPNTYQMFWNATPEKLAKRMKKEHDKFWNQERLDKIRKLGLSPVQAYTLASIVEKESNYVPERPTIAGVYINRLKTGMKLQADPTVVFATGEYDLKRVLYSHLAMDSPYNTYMYEGLPPGPIYMPSISSLEAVINAEQHDFIFFCAKADNSGKHVFASTLQEPSKNARLFSTWLNTIGIK